MRYRQPGDVIRLVAAGSVWRPRPLWPRCCPVAAGCDYLRRVCDFGRAPRDRPGAGEIAAAGLVLLDAARRYRRFRVLVTVAGGFAAAAALLAGITYLTGAADSAVLRHGSWLTGAGFAGAAVLAGLAAVAVAAVPWRAGRGAGWPGSRWCWSPRPG